MKKRSNSPPIIARLVLVILAIGLFLGGTSTLRTLTPPYVQLSIASLAAHQSKTDKEVKNLTVRMDEYDEKIDKLDVRITKQDRSNGALHGTTN